MAWQASTLLLSLCFTHVSTPALPYLSPVLQLEVELRGLRGSDERHDVAESCRWQISKGPGPYKVDAPKCVT